MTELSINYQNYTNNKKNYIKSENADHKILTTVIKFS
jgi:hypothetical protein